MWEGLIAPPQIHPIRCAGAGGCCWSGVRGKHYWLVLEQNRVIVANIKYPPIPSVKWRGGAKGPESHPRIDLGTTVRTDRDGG